MTMDVRKKAVKWLDVCSRGSEPRKIELKKRKHDQLIHLLPHITNCKSGKKT